MSTPSSASPPTKILMLHGYTQSGPLFHAKTRALEKHLQKALPHSAALIYPTAPLALKPSDIPGYDTSNNSDAESQPEAFGWWRRSNTSDPIEYLGLEDGLSAVAKTLREDGPFDGIIGFSQGASMAAIVASLLEPGRQSSFAHFSSQDSGLAIPYPPSFSGLSHPPLKFAVCYSGFRAPGPRYRGFFEEPAIQTPVLHVLGSLDSVVEESRSLSLVAACTSNEGKDRDGLAANESVVWHPGGHFLPSQRVYLDRAALFIKNCLEGDGKKKQTKLDVEERAEDMDMPF